MSGFFRCLFNSFKWRKIRDHSLMSVLNRCPLFPESRLTGSTFRKKIIRVKKTHGAAAPCTRITWASFLGSEKPSLKLLRSAKLQRTNFSPISNCRCLKSAIFLSRNIKLEYKFIVAVLHRNTYYIYIG